jgi:Tfp pilus assembly protein PilO
MTASRWWVLGGVLGGVLLLVLAWFFLISPKLSEATQARESAELVRVNNRQLQLRIEQLKAQAENLPEKQSELDILAVQLPPTPDIPDLVRQLSETATQTGVDLVSVVPGPPTPLSAATDPPNETGTPTTAPGPPSTSTGLVQISVSLQVSGAFANVTLFLGRLETLPRAFLTSGFSITRGGDAETGSAVLTTDITASVFYLPGLPTVLPTPTPVGGSTLPTESVVPMPSVSGT